MEDMFVWPASWWVNYVVALKPSFQLYIALPLRHSVHPRYVDLVRDEKLWDADGYHRDVNISFLQCEQARWARFCVSSVPLDLIGMSAGIENTGACTMVLAELGKEGLLPAVLINEIKNGEWCELALKGQFPSKRHEKC